MSKLGAGSAFGIVKESTWGTGVSPRTNWRRPISMNFSRQFPLVKTGTIGASFETKDVDGYETAEAQAVFELTYENFGMHIEACLWATVSTGTVSGTQYPHTYNIGASAPVGMTLEGIEGDTGNALVMQGALVSTWEISHDVSQTFARLTTNWIGQDIAVSGSPSTPSYGSGDESVIAKQGATLSWDSSTYCLRSLTIRGNNSIERRFCIGETYTEKPLQTAPRTIEGEMVVDYTASLDTKYAALTEGNATLTFTGSGDNELSYTLRNMKITRIDKPIQGQGVITQRIAFRCRENPSGTYPLQIVIKNSNSSGTAN